MKTSNRNNIALRVSPITSYFTEPSLINQLTISFHLSHTEEDHNTKKLFITSKCETVSMNVIEYLIFQLSSHVTIHVNQIETDVRLNGDLCNCAFSIESVLLNSNNSKVY